MKRACKVTVIDKKCFPDLQEVCLDGPASGPCPLFEVGDEFLFEREEDDADFELIRDLRFPCNTAWDCLFHFICAAFVDDAPMRGWPSGRHAMLICCTDGAHPVFFKLERFAFENSAATRREATG